MSLTREKRTELVCNLVPLALWYVQRHHDLDQGDFSTFQRLLTAQTPIYRLTEFWDGTNHPASGWEDERWNAICRKLYDLLQCQTVDFESAGAGLFTPTILARIDTDLRAWPWIPCGYCPYKLPDENIFGPFVYEKAVSSEHASGGRISIHIGNSRIPHSPFENMEQLRQDLLALVESVMIHHPTAKFIGCSSWLNSFDPFLTLFPKEWPQPEVTPYKVSFGYNWWGQFVARTGGFNFRNAKQMRTTGMFPFPVRNGYCTIESLHRHLA